MQVTLPNELVAEIVIKELSSLFLQLTEQRETLENGTYIDIPTYSTDLDEEYTEVKRDYTACQRILEYYRG